MLFSERIAGFILFAWVILCISGVKAKGVLLLTGDTPTSSIGIQHDKHVPIYNLNALTTAGKTGVGFATELRGMGKGWAGISVETPNGLPGMDELALEVSSRGRTQGIFITLTEGDGSRWNAFIRATHGWKETLISINEFTWFQGPESRRATRPRSVEIRSIQLWCDSRFEGENGLNVARFVTHDRHPEPSSIDIETTTVAIGQPATLTLVAKSETGEVLPYDSTLWFNQHSHDHVILPESVEMKGGWATCSLFARKDAPISLRAYDHRIGLMTSSSVTVEASTVTARINIKGVDNKPVTYLNQPTTLTLELSGDTTIPLTAHLTIRNSLGKAVLSRYYEVSDILSGQASVSIPALGMLSAELRLLAEPRHLFPQATEPLTRLRTSQADSEVTTPGLRRERSLSFYVIHEDLLSTATVVAEDKFPVFSLAHPPMEWRFNRWPFGICSGQLFHITSAEIATTGARRLRWHQALGSNWGRNDLWWGRIQPAPGTFSWSQTNRIVQLHKEIGIRMLGILAYGAKWKNGDAPASAEDFQHWSDFVSAVAEKFPNQLWAVEVWNEPDTQLFWKPEPDPTAYAELVRRTWKAFRSKADSSGSGPHVVAGSTAGISPGFANTVLSQTGTTESFSVWSSHLYPDAKSRSPEDNLLSSSITEIRNILAQHGVNKEIWLTEIGWPTGPHGVSTVDQANYLVRTHVIGLFNKLNKLFWFNLFDWESDPWAGEWGGHTGLLDSHYQPKPSVAAYNLTMFLLNESRPRKVSRQGRATIYSFDLDKTSIRWPGALHVIWTDEKNIKQNVEIAIEAGGGLYAFDCLGGEIALPGKSTSAANDSTTGTYQFSAGYEPTFIWDVGPPLKERQ